MTHPAKLTHSQVYLSHLFVARDARVKTRNLDKQSALLWHHVRGGTPWYEGVPEEEDYVIEIMPRPQDTHPSCGPWAARGECRSGGPFTPASSATPCLRHPVSSLLTGGRSLKRGWAAASLTLEARFAGGTRTTCWVLARPRAGWGRAAAAVPGPPNSEAHWLASLQLIGWCLSSCLCRGLLDAGEPAGGAFDVPRRKSSQVATPQIS